MDCEIQDVWESGIRPDTMLSFLKKGEVPSGKEIFGQIYVNTISPGKIRGNHYHKKRHEWLSCISGKVEVTVQDIGTKEKKSFILDSSEKPIKRLHVSAMLAHSVKNIGQEKAVILEYSSEEHNPQQDDFFKHEVK